MQRTYAQIEKEDAYLVTAEYYDHVGPYRNRKDVQFYVDLAREANGRVLELGCGTGRVLIPTAEAGVDITGLDASLSMLEVCRQKLASLPSTLHKRTWLVQGDFRNFDLEEQYDLITMPFRPFQHLIEVEDQLACLAAVRRHLAPDGRFVFDLFNPSIPGLADQSKLEHAQVEDEVTMPDGRRFVRSHKFVKKDFNRQVNDLELIHDVIWPDGTTSQEIFAFKMRYFFRYEIEHLLVRAGFSIDAIYANWDKEPFGGIYPGELIIVARRT